jgi:hypothetical protein
MQGPKSAVPSFDNDFYRDWPVNETWGFHFTNSSQPLLHECNVNRKSYKTAMLSCKMAVYPAILQESEPRLIFSDLK